MRLTTFVGGFLAGCAVMGLAAMTLAPRQDPGEMNQDQMEQMWQEAMEKYGAPGEHHAELAKRAGTWRGEVKFWMDPSMPPEVHYGDAKFEMAMDGRYLMQHFTMDYNGMPFEGAGLLAYDRLGEEYQSIWIDNMSTAIAWATGKEKKGELVFKGKMPDIMQGKYVMTRSTERMVDEDTIVTEMFAPGPDGNEYKNMEITYTRVHSAQE